LIVDITKACPNVQCPSGECVNAVTDCQQFLKICPSGMFPCTNGECTSNTSLCKESLMCLSGVEFQCFDGSCVSTSSECPPFPSCPYGTQRCGTTCINVGSNCLIVPQCSAFICPDGTCVLSKNLCPPYDGCAQDSPIQCADGICVTDISACLCNGNGIRCFNGSCVQNASMCSPPPGQLKPASVIFTIDILTNSTLHIWKQDYSEILCFVDFPIGVFQLIAPLLENSNGTLNVAINSLADSILEQIQFPSWVSNTNPISYIYSPVLSLTIPNLGTLKQVNFSGEVSIRCRFTIPSSTNMDEICLASTTTETWSCQDRYPELSTQNGFTSLDGNTNHFTNFALLLGASNGQGTSEQISSAGGQFQDWIIGVIVAAIIVVIAGMGIITIYLYRKRRNSRKSLEKIYNTQPTAE